MLARELVDNDPPPTSDSRRQDDLAQQVRHLQERLAFYEGFDLLIQDNVANARELFRLAVQERESASANANRARWESGLREAELRRELEAVSVDLQSLAAAVEALSQRVAKALGDPVNGKLAFLPGPSEQQLAIVVHGVPSARLALALQRHVGALPQVSDVSAREFVGGMLRLDARVRGAISLDQLRAWENGHRLHLLTERPDVIEVALERP